MVFLVLSICSLPVDDSIAVVSQPENIIFYIIFCIAIQKGSNWDYIGGGPKEINRVYCGISLSRLHEKWFSQLIEKKSANTFIPPGLYIPVRLFRDATRFRRFLIRSNDLFEKGSEFQRPISISSNGIQVLFLIV